MTTRKWLIPLAVLSVVWGSSFLFIEVGLRELTPLQVALARVLLGAATIAVVLAVSRTPLPASRRMWGHIAVVAVTFNVIPFILFAWAQTHISSVLAGIWNATTPLWTVPMALVLIPSARLDPQRFLGLILGFGGVVVVLGPWDVDLISSEVVLGSVACLAATACYGFSVTYMSRFLADGACISLVGGQLIVATTVLAFITLPNRQPAHTHFGRDGAGDAWVRSLRNGDRLRADVSAGSNCRANDRIDCHLLDATGVDHFGRACAR